MSWCIDTTSAQETIDLGKKVGELLRTKNIAISLIGDLGSGKTTFTKGVAQGLGVTNEIKSPTFVMLKEYDCRYGKLVHVDAYRLSGDFEDIGLGDYFGNANVLIEWADNISGVLSSEVLRIEFEHVGVAERRICFDEKLNDWKDVLAT